MRQFKIAVSIVKEYYRLTKPGIVYGNLVTTVGGFLLASRGHFDFWLFLATVSGIGLVMASGCVFNNYIDRNIDRAMNRTKQRALVQGTIPIQRALSFGGAIGFTGLLILGLFTNLVTASLALVGFVFYVFLYGYAKRRSSFGTFVGAVSGAVPIVVGYTGVSGQFDLAAVLLFLVLFFWQMPHFYAIAMYRLHDYKAAGIPVLPATRGMAATKLMVGVNIFAFFIAACLLFIFGYTGYLYLAVMIIVSSVWFFYSIQNVKDVDYSVWARKMFRFSLVVLLTFSIMISLNHVLV